MERAQHGFSALKIILAFVVLLVTATAAAETMGRDVAQKLRGNVVRVKAQLGDHPENGFGFIVGERAGMLYIATAYHVVSDPQDVGGAQPATVKVELFDHQGEMKPATLLGTHDAEHDLAVLTVAAPSGIHWIGACLGREPQGDETADVWVVGRSQKWDVPAVAGKVSAVSDGRIDVDGLPVRPGSSGAPLVAASGIVGMILRDSAETAQALTMAVIKDRFRQWNHPWDLRPSTADSASPPSHTPLRPGPPKIIISNIIRSDEVHFDTSVPRLGDLDKRILDDVAARMKLTTAAEALIIGHTDSSENTGPYADLDRRRADAVRDYLVLQGVDASRISTEGRSIREPVGDDSVVTGRALNRRAEIKLLLRE